MSRKKIVFAIVEGPSDEEALGVIMSRIYDKNSVYFHVMHCDITTEYGINPGNIVAKIGNTIKDYAQRNHFRQCHFCQIIHIVDMDGAFIPNEKVIELEPEEYEEYEEYENKPYYSVDGIITRSKANIVDRNERKRNNLTKLISTHTIWKIPYSVYYMSCNLDHALYGKLNSSDREKENDSFYFAQKYKDDTQAFLSFILNSDFSVTGEYSVSWKYIREGMHSLERHTNLGICFKTDEGQLLTDTSSGDSSE